MPSAKRAIKAGVGENQFWNSPPEQRKAPEISWKHHPGDYCAMQPARQRRRARCLTLLPVGEDVFGWALRVFSSGVEWDSDTWIMAYLKSCANSCYAGSSAFLVGWREEKCRDIFAHMREPGTDNEKTCFFFFAQKGNTSAYILHLLKFFPQSTKNCPYLIDHITRKNGKLFKVNNFFYSVSWIIWWNFERIGQISSKNFCLHVISYAWLIFF
jgi:hypothetical protein